MKWAMIVWSTIIGVAALLTYVLFFWGAFKDAGGRRASLPWGGLRSWPIGPRHAKKHDDAT
jgi:hypothetical protein